MPTLAVMTKSATFFTAICFSVPAGNLGFASEAAFADEKQADVEAKSEDIRRWVEQLSDDEFKVRNEATERLAAAGARAVPAVVRAAKSKDVEVRQRATSIIKGWVKSGDEPIIAALKKASPDDFERFSKLDAVVYFVQADWCPVCVKMRPEVDKLKSKGYPIQSVDITRDPDKKLRFGVRAIPTIVVVIDDKIVARRTGMQTQDKIESMLKEIRAAAKPKKAK